MNVISRFLREHYECQNREIAELQMADLLEKRDGTARKVLPNVLDLRGRDAPEYKFLELF